MNTEITLAEYLNGSCIYGGCKYNDMGYCISEDEDLLSSVERLSVNVEDNQYEYIDCNSRFEYNHCMYCGVALQVHRESHPYGDTYSYEYLAYCPNCG